MQFYLRREKKKLRKKEGKMIDDVKEVGPWEKKKNKKLKGEITVSIIFGFDKWVT